MLRMHGESTKYHHDVTGLNSRLDSLQAAILNVKLPHLDHWTAARQANADRYTQLFAACGLDRILSLPQVAPRDLENAWRSLLARARLGAHHKVTRNELSVREHMSAILRLLAGGAFREFTELFEPWRGVAVLIVNFLALLELAREGLVDITQAEGYAPIYVKLADAESRSAPPMGNP
jgi:chromatin segregation and condensation protein Rec8/ScpA/Scc1 (kleisin family)